MISQIRSGSKFIIGIIVFFCYLIITLILTYPVCLNITSEIAGLGSDTHLFVSQIIGNYNAYAQIGFLTSAWNIIANLRVDTLTLHVLLYAIFGSPLGYNLFWLFSYVVSAFGMYLLTQEVIYASLKKKFMIRFESYIRISSFFSGIVYAFTPAHVAWSMGFSGATHIEWIPFTTLYIIKFIKTPRLKYLIIASIFFLLLVRGEYHFAAIYILFLFPLSIFYVWKNKTILQNKLFWRFSVGGIIALVIAVIWLFQPFIEISSSDNNWLNPGMNQVIRYSNDVLSIIIPPFTNSLTSDAFFSIRNNFTGNKFENSAYIGVIVLFLTSVVFIYKKYKIAIFWALSSIGFYILSLGPFLHLKGLIEPMIPLPYIYIYQYIPFFKNIRVVDRFAIIAVLCFAVSAGYGLLILLKKYGRKKTIGTLIASVALLFLIGEYLPIPIPTTPIPYSSFYDFIKGEQEDFSIIEIPSATNYRSAARSQYYQSIHQKKMLNYFQFARKDESDPKVQLEQKTPIINQLLYFFPRGGQLPSDIIDHNYAWIGKRLLRTYNVKYVILHKKFIGEGEDQISLTNFLNIKNTLEDTFNFRLYYQDNDLIAYIIDPTDSNFYILTLGDNWNDIKQEKDGVLVRSIKKSPGQILIQNYSKDSKSISISMDIRADKKASRKVEILNRDEVRDSFIVSDRFERRNLYIDNIEPGENPVMINVYDLEGNLILDDHSAVIIKDIRYADTSTKDLKNAQMYQNIIQEAHDGRLLQVPAHSGYKINGFDRVDEIIDKDVLIEEKNGEKFLNFGKTGFKEIFLIKDRNISQAPDIRENNFYNRILNTVYKRNNIKSIIIHSDLFEKNELKKVIDFFSTYLRYSDIIYENENIIFKLDDTVDEESLILNIGVNWDVVKEQNGYLYREMKTDGELQIENITNEKQVADFHFKTSMCGTLEKNVNFYLNDTFLEKFTVRPGESNHIIHLDKIKQGNNIIKLRKVGDNDTNKEKCSIQFYDILLKIK